MRLGMVGVSFCRFTYTTAPAAVPQFFVSRQINRGEALRYNGKGRLAQRIIIVTYFSRIYSFYRRPSKKFLT